MMKVMNVDASKVTKHLLLFFIGKQVNEVELGGEGGGLKTTFRLTHQVLNSGQYK